MQVSESNPMDGLQGRAEVLVRLASAMRAHPEHFGSEGGGRPAGIVGRRVSIVTFHRMIHKPRFPTEGKYHSRRTDKSPHQFALACSYALIIDNVAVETFYRWYPIG